MKKMEQLYEGKAKKVFKTDDENLYIVDYKDDATAFNGLKKGQIAGCYINTHPEYEFNDDYTQIWRKESYEQWKMATSRRRFRKG